MHGIFVDLKAWELFLGYVADRKPQRIILNGDVCDFWELSTFERGDSRAKDTQYELDFVHDVLLKPLRKTAPEADIIWNEGNHDNRLARAVANNLPKLGNLRALDIRELLALRELRIKYNFSTGRDSSCWVGPVEVGHFNKVCKHSAGTARQLVEERGETCVQSHVHRLGAFYKTLRARMRELVGFEAGCLCQLNPDPQYIANPNWQQGFVSIAKCDDSSRFHIELHEVIGGELFADGKRYS